MTWSTLSSLSPTLFRNWWIRARAAAKANVLGVEHTMALENQASGNLEQAIEAEAQRLTRKRKRT